MEEKNQPSSLLSSTLVLLTQGLSSLPTTIHYQKKRKWECEVSFSPLQHFWSVPLHTHPPRSAVAEQLSQAEPGSSTRRCHLTPSQQMMVQPFLAKRGFCA